MALGILAYMIVMTLLGALMQIATVGKSKEPKTPPQAALYTFIALLHVTAYGYLATQV